MGCEPIWGHGNRGHGVDLLPGREGLARWRIYRTVRECGRPGDLLCDGPHPSGSRRRTCSRPLCRECAVQLRAVDVDYCPEHGQEPQPDIGGECPCGSVPGARCLGALVVKVGGLCLRHAVLFDHWLGHEGGLALYRRRDLDQEAKREHFRAWLQAKSAAALDLVLIDRHLPGLLGP